MLRSVTEFIARILTNLVTLFLFLCVEGGRAFSRGAAIQSKPGSAITNRRDLEVVLDEFSTLS